MEVNINFIPLYTENEKVYVQLGYDINNDKYIVSAFFKLINKFETKTYDIEKVIEAKNLYYYIADRQQPAEEPGVSKIKEDKFTLAEKYMQENFAEREPTQAPK